MSNKPRLLLLFACCFLALQAGAQCVLSIGGLPDSMRVCRNAQIQLNTTLISSGGTAVPTDTTWSPATGLSNIHILNPVASITTTPIQYTLSVTSITAQNFVDNGDFSLGNTGFSSSYIDTNGPGSLWPEGYYSIVTNPNNVHPNFASFGDHTTSTGNMMVINGASSPVNIWCQTITVTPNTQYDFSAWGASCTPSNPAQLQFEINGNLVGTSLQLPGTTGQWTEFHVVWNSGTNTSITICIHDQQTALSGNDFAIDDISFRQICVATDSVYIQVDNVVPSINEVVKLGCQADTVILTALNSGTMPDFYRWDFGDASYIDTTSNPTHVYLVQGLYTIQLKESTIAGCGDSASVTVDTRHTLSINFTADKDTICATQSVQFTSNDVGTKTPLVYYWDFGDGTTDVTASPSHTYNTAGIYKVVHIVNDQVPCYDTMSMYIVVLQGPTVTMTSNDSVICRGRDITFTGALFGGYQSLTWDFGDNSFLYDANPVIHAFDAAGNFNVTMQATFRQCPPITITKFVQVFDVPNVNIGRDTSICPNASALPLSNLALESNAVSYLWSTGDQSPTSVARVPGVYWLTVTNAGGCSATDSITILKSCYLDVPNVFSPNGDGINDYFFPRQLLSKQLRKFHMEIFNRWGEVIFQTDNLDGRGWDGKFNGAVQPEGVYIYMIDVIVDGMAEENLKGNVTLIR